MAHTREARASEDVLFFFAFSLIFFISLVGCFFNWIYHSISSISFFFFCFFLILCIPLTAMEIPGTSQCDLQELLPVSPGLMSTVDGTGPFIVQAYPACMYLDLLGYGLFNDRFINLEKGGKNTGYVYYTMYRNSHGGADL